MKSKAKYFRAASALIKDPLLIYRTGKKMRKLKLIGDVRNALIVFLACLTMYIDEKVSVMIASPSSSGKSTRIEKPLMLFPPECVIRRASLSRKAFAYGEGSLDRKILYINEYRRGREGQLLLRILQSDGAISHEYTRSGKTRVVKRVGSPVVLTTTSEGAVVEDDSTRFLTLNIEPNPDQILEVLKASISPPTRDKEPGLEVWRETIRKLSSKAKKPFIIPDWFEYIAEQVPHDKVRAMRDWKRWLGLIKAVCLCRPQSGSRNKISFADYCVAYRILNPALTATVHAINENELPVQKTVSKLNKKQRRAITAKEVGEHLGWDRGVTYKYVRSAVKVGLIQYEGGPEKKTSSDYCL